MKYVIITLFLLLSSIGKSQAQYTDTQQSYQYSEAHLAQILAPIALYPDTLLTHILIASTYPLELVQAQRWLDKHDHLSADRLADKLQGEVNEKKWDASVKALMAFPNVVQRLSDDLDWTQQLGDAFLSDETLVLASIQQLRRQAQQAGSLAKMTNSSVSYEGNNIVIEPQQAQVIYVPYYDARHVYGTWHWGHYPPVYWSIPRHYHSAHYSSHYSSPYYQPFYWQPAVHIRHHFFFGAFHWHKRHVVVIKHYNKPYYGHHRNNKYSYNNRRKVVTSTGAKRWQHKPEHRRGVSYSNKQLNKRFKAKRHSTQWTKNNVKPRNSHKGKQVISARHYQSTKAKPYNKTVKHSNRIKKDTRRHYQSKQERGQQVKGQQANQNHLTTNQLRNNQQKSKQQRSKQAKQQLRNPKKIANQNKQVRKVKQVKRARLVKHERQESKMNLHKSNRIVSTKTSSRGKAISRAQRHKAN